MAFAERLNKPKAKAAPTAEQTGFATLDNAPPSNGPGATPSTASGLPGQGFGFDPGSIRAGANFLSLGTGLARTNPMAQLAFEGSKLLSGLMPDVVTEGLKSAAPMGIVGLDAPGGFSVSGRLGQGGGLMGMLASALGLGGAVTGMSAIDEFGMPGPPLSLNAPAPGAQPSNISHGRTADDPAFSSPYGAGLTGGLGTSNVGAPGQQTNAARGSNTPNVGFDPADKGIDRGEDTTTGPAASPSSPSGPGTGEDPSGGLGEGPSSGSATGGGTDAAEAHMGGQVPGGPENEPTMRLQGGETVVPRGPMADMIAQMLIQKSPIKNYIDPRMLAGGGFASMMGGNMPMRGQDPGLPRGEDPGQPAQPGGGWQPPMGGMPTSPVPQSSMPKSPDTEPEQLQGSKSQLAGHKLKEILVRFAHK